MKSLEECRLYAFVDTAYLHGREPALVARQLCDGGADIIQMILRRVCRIHTRRRTVGLNCNFIADLPILHVAASFQHDARDLAAGRARKLERHRQTGLFEPKVEMVQAAALNLDDNFARAGLRVGGVREVQILPANQAR